MFLAEIGLADSEYRNEKYKLPEHSRFSGYQWTYKHMNHVYHCSGNSFFFIHTHTYIQYYTLQTFRPLVRIPI